MARVMQLKTAEDVYWANKTNKCPLCGGDFQLDDAVIEIETERLPWLNDKLTLLIHADCLNKLVGDC